MSPDPRYGRKQRPVPAPGAAVEHQGRAPRLLPWIVGAMTFLVYLRTLTPGMQMGDGTELAAAAYVLGVPHPTGYPLYMLLCKLWLVLTVGGDPILRTTLLNALLMSASAGLTSVILLDLARALWQSSADKAAITFAAAGGLAAGFLRFHWANAVVTEVYALQFFLMILFVRVFQKIDLGRLIGRRSLLVATVLLALGLAHHRLSITMVLPWAVLWVLAFRRGKNEPARLPYLWATIILISGAALYAYIPLRAMADPPVNWGNADTPERFYNHVRGTEYLNRGLLKPALGQEFSGASLAVFTRFQTMHLLTDMVGQFYPVYEKVQLAPGGQKAFVTGTGLTLIVGLALSMFAAYGLWKIWRGGQRFLAACLFYVALQNVAILYVYNIPDIRDYFLFPFWAGWIGLLALACHLAGRLSLPGRQWAAYTCLLVPALLITTNWSRCNRNDDVSAEVLSATILPETASTMPASSILLTDDDSETFTTWYRQKVRGERRDVLHFAGNFVYMPWYSAFFSPQELSDYKITLASAVARDANEYAMQLRRAIIDANIATHPVFCSINDPAVLQAWSQTYTVTPVDAVKIVNHGLFDETVQTVLYRITQKEQAQ